jgi:hypothetical protein
MGVNILAQGINTAPAVGFEPDPLRLQSDALPLRHRASRDLLNEKFCVRVFSGDVIDSKPGTSMTKLTCAPVAEPKCDSSCKFKFFLIIFNKKARSNILLI